MKKLIALISITMTMTTALFAQTANLNVLLFTKTAGYRHASIPAGIKMMNELSHERNWTLTATEDAEIFTSDLLSHFDVVVFISPTKETLNDKQRECFKAFMEKGKGFVGVHAATDCEFTWPWYGRLVGAYFKTHPRLQEATIIIENDTHPAMTPFKGMKTYHTFDEWYSFTENPRGKVTVLATLDEKSLNEESLKDKSWQMGDHPLIWYQEIGNVRSFYTAFGHTDESFQNPKVREHIGQAVDWAGKRL